MAINGNRILGSITNGSYVLCLAKSLIQSEDVYFLPVYDTVNSRMTWISATPNNLPSLAEGHVKWFVFKVKSAANGKFYFESNLTTSLEATDSPILEDIQQNLDMTQTGVSGSLETVLTSLPETINLQLSLVDKVSLFNDKLWSGIWYTTIPSAGIAAAKIKNSSGWALFGDLSDLTVYQNIQLSFMVCGGVQQAKDGQCSTLKFFSPLTFIQNWVLGNQDYNLKNCDHTEADSYCLYSTGIAQIDGDTPACNGFRGYYYGDSCKDFEYADVCGDKRCIYNDSNALGCNSEKNSNILTILIPLIIVIVIIIVAGLFLLRGRNKD